MNFNKNNRGQGLTEYMILVFLVAAVSVGTVHKMGRTVKGKLITAQRKIKTELTLEDKKGASKSGESDECDNPDGC